MERLGRLEPSAELRAIRAGLNITQAKMAEAMGIPLRTYEDLASGRSTVRPVHLKAAYFAIIEHAANNGGKADLPPDLIDLLTMAMR